MGKGPEEPKETAEQKAAAEIAQDQWNVYKTQYRPSEMAWVSDITGYDFVPTTTTTGTAIDPNARGIDRIKNIVIAKNDPRKTTTTYEMRPNGRQAARESRMEAQTSADTAQRYTRGIDPTRLKTFAPVNADTAGKFQVANNQAVKNQRLQGMQAAVDLGMGKASDVSLGFQEAASNSVTKQLADEKNSQLVKDTAVSAGMNLLGAAASAGMNYAKGPNFGDTIKGPDGPMTYIGKSGQGMQYWDQE